jgi:hypothetical protein
MGWVGELTICGSSSANTCVPCDIKDWTEKVVEKRGSSPTLESRKSPPRGNDTTFSQAAWGCGHPNSTFPIPIICWGRLCLILLLNFIVPATFYLRVYISI